MKRLVASLGLGLLLGAAPGVVCADEAGSAEGPKAPAPLWKQYERPRGLSYGGKVWTSLAPDLRMSGPYEDRFEWHSGVDFRVKYRFADGARFVIGSELRYVLRSGDRTEADLFVDLDETYLQLRKGRFSLRVGRFVQAWGRNALLSPLNQLAPLDSQMAFAPEGATRARIPTLAVRANLGLHPVALELIWLPVFQPARVSFYGRDFSVLRPGMLEGMLPGLVPQTGAGLADDLLGDATSVLIDSLQGLDPYARDGLQSYLLFGVPEEYLWNGDIGARIGLTGRGIDADFLVLWHTLDQPELRLHEDLRRPLLGNRLPDSGELTRLTNPGAKPVESVYHRNLMAGADVAIAAGGLVISAEAAYNTRGVYYQRDFGSYLSPHFSYAVAARYLYGTWAAFTLEFSHDILIEPAESSWLREQHDLRLAFLGTLRLFRERFQLTLSGAWDILQRDLYIHPRILVVVDDRLRVAFGASIFQGYREDVEPNLDSFRSYRGGLLGYYRHNDYGYATVELSF